MSTIRSIEVVEFVYDIQNCGTYFNEYLGVNNLCYQKGSKKSFRKHIVVIETEDGVRGEYAPHYVTSRSVINQVLELAPLLLGFDAEQRERIQSVCKNYYRHYDQTGISALDIALWDLAGKKYGASVSTLLGGFRKELPVYASTCLGQTSGGGLDSPQAYADFAMHCKSLGIPGFKIHAWRDGDPKKEVAVLHAVRNAVGNDMHLMTDPGCGLVTFLDALYVGKACDEVNCLWYEDPYLESASSACPPLKNQGRQRRIYLQSFPVPLCILRIYFQARKSNVLRVPFPWHK